MPFDSIEKKREYNRTYRGRPQIALSRKEYQRRWSEDNADHLKAKEAERRLTKRAMCLVATARTRAKKKGLAFDLDQFIPELQTRIDIGKCEVTGVLFDLSPGRKFNSPSLDRIDPSKGYTYENTRIVLNLVNAALGDWGEAVLRDVMTDWLLSTQKSRRNLSKRI